MTLTNTRCIIVDGIDSKRIALVPNTPATNQRVLVINRKYAAPANTSVSIGQRIAVVEGDCGQRFGVVSFANGICTKLWDSFFIHPCVKGQASVMGTFAVPYSGGDIRIYLSPTCSELQEMSVDDALEMVTATGGHYDWVGSGQLFTGVIDLTPYLVVGDNTLTFTAYDIYGDAFSCGTTYLLYST